MRTFGLLALISLGHLTWAADVKLPPVLRGNETTDSVVVTLPGAPPRVAPLPPPPPPAPEKAEATVAPLAPKPAPEVSRKAFLPPDLQKEVATFCQKLIGQWTEEDAEQIFGKALRNRLSFD